MGPVGIVSILICRDRVTIFVPTRKRARRALPVDFGAVATLRCSNDISDASPERDAFLRDCSSVVKILRSQMRHIVPNTLPRWPQFRPSGEVADVDTRRPSSRRLLPTRAAL